MFSLGSDPEFMLFDKLGNVKSAIGVVKGSANERIQVAGHEFYFDNVLAECAVKPAKGKKDVLASFQECIEIYSEIVKPLSLRTTAYHAYPESELTAPEARIVGCAVDRCAYKVKDMKPPKRIITETPARSGGGHVHIGLDNPEETIHRQYGLHIAPMVVMMDLFLGITSIHIDHDPTSAKRREIYGQAGRYRIKEYGLEYRTLGNFWLASPKLVGFIYDLCEVVLQLASKENAFYTTDFEKYCSSTPAKAYRYSFDTKKVQDAINKSEKTELIDLVLANLPSGLTKEFEKLSKPQTYDLYKEWNL